MAKHQPVLLESAINWLQPIAGEWYIDATFGRGGHTKAILDRQAKVIAFDVDTEAIEYGKQNFASEIEHNRLVLIRENFEKLETVVRMLQKSGQVKAVHGALFDFGTSADQLTSSDRGFSFSGEGALDMRMDDRLGVQAKDLLMLLSLKQLMQVFQDFGGEREAKVVSQAIIKARETGNFEKLQTTQGFADLVSKAKHEPRGHLHPATKVFQALRIAVNGELDSIKAALPQAVSVLEAPARIVAISFHEGEDRIVKQMYNNWQQKKQGTVLTKHPESATELELKMNSKARSAKLRVFSL